MSEPRRGLRHVERTMGTVFSFDIRDARTPAVESALVEAVSWLHRVDEVFSTYRPDSAVSRLARGELGLDDCPAEVREVLGLCEQVGHATEGWFSVAANGGLDPTGLVKGWAVERAVQILKAAGARHLCVNGGGDLQLSGEASPGNPWRIGIAHPLRPGELCTVVTGRDLAVATSGTAERGAHILDPRTGTPATGPASVTVVGRSLTTTDAFATAAFAMGAGARDWLEGLDGHEGFAVTRNGGIWHTQGFPGEVCDVVGPGRCAEEPPPGSAARSHL
ncbi:FAD:protein FMN transferase [Streptomyces sp. DSM 41527]|uniref:FAD:protein FMN transferase n=1 Tax=Streptomyces mooreae TaxID=3075523 RepID=A0ABU2T8V3_9ACTN|nr:FAD:protein FMN transferase [Streptomyces sp. DSM 41527]MDT0457345.1 FAD:protein FMN transferase [Streptomyces sp. DSM 41527]